MKIGNTPVEQVFEQIKQHIGTEHISGKYDRASLYLGMTELLFELGFSAMNTRALIEVESAGVTEVTEMRGEAYYQWYAFYMLAKNEREPLPYAHRLSKKNYWSEFDKSSGILTININNIKNDSDGPTFKAFSAMVGEQIKKLKFKKVVVDLRDNRGGSNFVARYFSTMLAKAYKLNKPGKLFVLTSGRTFSAAVNLSSLLENQTKPTLFLSNNLPAKAPINTAMRQALNSTIQASFYWFQRCHGVAVLSKTNAPPSRRTTPSNTILMIT
ncbi:MAG: hypothetical protein MJK04_37475 [Psychrosphaera sp.]|nr:hypothetical protein [Psychrosphaera sp.]